MTTETKLEPQFIPAYEGNDMLGYILDKVVHLYPEHQEIKSITNVRDTAIIVTDRHIYRARPEYQIGWCIECLATLL